MGPCHQGMARPRFLDGGDSIQMWWVAMDILIMQSGKADKG